VRWAGIEEGISAPEGKGKRRCFDLFSEICEFKFDKGFNNNQENKNKFKLNNTPGARPLFIHKYNFLVPSFAN
jgi:hypothetical protein